jgi:dTDP-4-amino-4,6-dideoxygalactose transaminase
MAALTMYVPTFQGLSAFDLLRPAAAESACFPFNAPRLGFYRARNAIYYLFQALQSLTPRMSVLVPDYNSGNEVLALQAAGARLLYYQTDRHMQADIGDIERLCKTHDPDVLYVIHYLGWPQPLDALRTICRRRTMLLVEDCALSLLSEPDGTPLGSSGDFSVFCLYKTLPVPNGSLLVQNTMPLGSLDRLRLRRAGAASVMGRIAELVVQRARGKMNGIGTALQSAKRALGKAAGALDVNRQKVGDIGFDIADVDLQMSAASERLLRRFDFDGIRRRRIENFKRLAAALDGTVTPVHAGLADGVCPLFYPMVVQDKPAAAQALRTHGVQALEFWNHGATAVDPDATDAVRFLRSHVLALPIHQDLSARQLNHMANRVAGLNLKAA